MQRSDIRRFCRLVELIYVPWWRPLKYRNRFRPVSQRCQCTARPLQSVASSKRYQTARPKAEYRQNRHLTCAPNACLFPRLIDPFRGKTTMKESGYLDTGRTRQVRDL